MNPIGFAGMVLCNYMVKMSKMAENWGFAPYSELKKRKKWRISAGLRAKNGRWGGKIPLSKVGDCKTAPAGRCFYRCF